MEKGVQKGRLGGGRGIISLAEESSNPLKGELLGVQGSGCYKGGDGERLSPSDYDKECIISLAVVSWEEEIGLQGAGFLGRYTHD